MQFDTETCVEVVLVVLVQEISWKGTSLRWPQVSYGMTQCYMPLEAGKNAPLTPAKQVLDLPTLKGWKAELTLVLVRY